MVSSQLIFGWEHKSSGRSVVAVTRLGTTVRDGTGKGSFPWVNTGAALQLKKCKGKPKSDSTERDSGFQVFFPTKPQNTCLLGNKRRGFWVSPLLNSGAIKELVHFSCHYLAQGRGSQEDLSLSVWSCSTLDKQLTFTRRGIGAQETSQKKTRQATDSCTHVCSLSMNSWCIIKGGTVPRGWFKSSPWIQHLAFS